MNASTGAFLIWSQPAEPFEPDVVYSDGESLSSSEPASLAIIQIQRSAMYIRRVSLSDRTWVGRGWRFATLRIGVTTPDGRSLGTVLARLRLQTPLETSRLVHELEQASIQAGYVPNPELFTSTIKMAVRLKFGIADVLTILSRRLLRR